MALGFFVGNRVTVARVCGGVVPNCITECRPVTNLLARLCFPKKEERIVVRVVALTIGSKEGGGCEVENLSIICSSLAAYRDTIFDSLRGQSPGLPYSSMLMTMTKALATRGVMIPIFLVDPDPEYQRMVKIHM